MRRLWRPLLAGVLGSLALLALLARPSPVPLAQAQGVGIFERTDCSAITSPVSGQTWCFDSTNRVLKVWNGTLWATSTISNVGASGFGGVFSVANCTAITSPIVGQSFCFDQTANTLKFWNGSQWLSQGFATPSFVNLLDFGCVGDNSTDNTTCITNALAALNTVGDSGSVGGMIYVPPGAYRHSGTINWPNKDYVIFGASDLVSVFRYTGTATGNQINSNGSTFPNKFQNLEFTTINTNGTLFDIQGGGRVIFEDVRFRAESGNPILVRTTGNTSTATQQTTFRNVYVNCNLQATIGVQLSGINLPGTATTNFFGGRINQCTQGAGVALDASTSEGLNVWGTNIEGNLIGVRLDGVRAVTLDGLWYESNTTTDVQIRSTTVGTVGIDIRNSRWASSANPTNIDIIAPGTVTRGVKILHNSFTTASGTANIRIGAGVIDTTIAFNTFSNATEISDAGTRTMKVGNVLAANVLTPIQTNSDAGPMLLATGTATNAAPATSRLQVNASSAGATTRPLTVMNIGTAAVNTGAAIDFAFGSTAGDDVFASLVGSTTNVTGGSRAGQLDLVTNVSSGLTTILRATSGVQIGGTGGLPTGGSMGTGTINYASASFANGLSVIVASATGPNLTNIRGLSASSSIANNLRGRCTFAAAATCQVAFTNNEPDANYDVLVGGVVDVANKTRAGFTLNATTTTSNTVSWFIVR